MVSPGRHNKSPRSVFAAALTAGTTGELTREIGVLLADATLAVPGDTGSPSALAPARSDERRHTNELPPVSPDAIAL